MAERAGFEPAEELLLRRFSKPLVSATHPPLRAALAVGLFLPQLFQRGKFIGNFQGIKRAQHFQLQCEST